MIFGQQKIVRKKVSRGKEKAKHKEKERSAQFKNESLLVKDERKKQKLSGQ